MDGKSFIGRSFHSMLIFLAFSSFAILLGGVAAMQDRCGQASGLTDRILGTVGYLAPVPCDRLFSFDWWITFFQGFLTFFLLYVMVASSFQTWRNAVTGLCTIGALLTMMQANTWCAQNVQSEKKEKARQTYRRTRPLSIGSIYRFAPFL